MPVRKTALLNGTPKRPMPPVPHPGMRHAAIVGGEKAMVEGVTSTQLAHMMRADQRPIHQPSTGKRLSPAVANPGCRDHSGDSAAGSVVPAAIVDRAAPGAVKPRRI